MKGKIFNAQEVRAMLNGSKVMFREVIKPYPILSNDKSYWEFKGIRWAGENSSYARKFGDNARPEISELAPFQVGETIFVKEAFAKWWNDSFVYKADITAEKVVSKWYLPQHIKQENSRLTLRIKSVKVERLADISEEDAIKEGATSRPNCHSISHKLRDAFEGWAMDWSRVGKRSRYSGILTESHLCSISARYAFAEFWDSTHKKPEEKFEANPWVWCFNYEVVKNN